VEKALLMATRVVVLSERPARVVVDMSVEKPYPRHRDNPDIAARRASILSRLGVET
jgi:NitT/TauT family transport system ATP-binding protein